MSEEMKETEEVSTNPEELMKSFFDAHKLAEMDKESLKHWENILSSIFELRRLHNEGRDHAMGLWSLLLMTVFPLPSKENLKEIEDEQGIKNGKSDPMEEGIKCC